MNVKENGWMDRLRAGLTISEMDRHQNIDLLRCISIGTVVFSHYGVTKIFYLGGVPGMAIF
jgi:hypothetical protein